MGDVAAVYAGGDRERVDALFEVGMYVVVVSPSISVGMEGMDERWSHQTPPAATNDHRRVGMGAFGARQSPKLTGTEKVIDIDAFPISGCPIP